MHREIVISFKCKLSNDECKTIFKDCNNCIKNKTKDTFFVIRKDLLGIPMELNVELSVAKIKLEYLPKVIDKFHLEEVMFSDIEDVIKNYPLYRNFLKEQPLMFIGKYYYKKDFPLAFSSRTHVYLFVPDTPD